mgnify:CR=1 FL=1
MTISNTMIPAVEATDTMIAVKGEKSDVSGTLSACISSIFRDTSF